MDNILTIIKEQEVLGKQFIAYGTIEQPLFLAKDVAEWIDYSKTSEGYYNVSKMLKTVDEDEKITITNSNSGGKKVYLTENGLYEVLMQSRKPIAKLFKKEVKQILKQIRQTGGYIPLNTTTGVSISDEEIMARALIIAHKTIELKNKELITANDTIKILKPKADYTDKILQSKSLMNITQIAQDYGMSAISFNKLLEKFKVQYKDKSTGQWILYAKYKGLNWVGSCSQEITRLDGRQDVVLHTKWTQTGRLGLYNLLKEHGYIPVMEAEYNEYINSLNNFKEAN